MASPQTHTLHLITAVCLGSYYLIIYLTLPDTIQMLENYTLLTVFGKKKIKFFGRRCGVGYMWGVSDSAPRKHSHSWVHHGNP